MQILLVWTENPVARITLYQRSEKDQIKHLHPMSNDSENMVKTGLVAYIYGD